MLNQPADEALTGADMKGWQRPRENCMLLIHYFPASRGYLENSEKMKIFHLCKKFFSLTAICAVLLKHYIVLKQYFTPNLLLEKRKLHLKSYVYINYNSSYYFGLAFKCKLLTFCAVSTEQIVKCYI